MIACDVITTPAHMPLPQRLQAIYTGLSEIIATYHPGEAAMEELFFAKNARTALPSGRHAG
jgi:crossover junction endodeoxyribonuclease RuvC